MIPFVNIHTHTIDSHAGIQIYNCSHIDDIFIHKHSCSYGLHPWHVESIEQVDLFCELLESILQQNLLLCIGECGIDRAIQVDFELQLYALHKQLELAQRYKLPVIIHCVRAYYEIVSLLSNVSFTLPVIFHKFSGNSHAFTQIMKHNSYVSFGVEICTRKTNVFFSAIPLNKIFIETDSNNSKNIVQVYECFAKLYSSDIEYIKQQLFDNYTRVFGM